MQPVLGVEALVKDMEKRKKLYKTVFRDTWENVGFFEGLLYLVIWVT